MVRHPNQQLGPAQKLAPRTTGMNDPRIRGVVSGYTNEATKERDAKALESVWEARKLKPPHRHQWSKGVCRICAAPEVEST